LTSEAADAAKAQSRKTDASPKLEDWKREFGNKVKVDERTGEYSLTLREDGDIRKAHQMQEQMRRIEVERGHEVQSKWDGKRAKVVRSDGKRMNYPEELLDSIKGKVRPAGRNGGAPSIRVGLSDSFGKYEQGPDGLWFVWDGGWEPTNLFIRGPVGEKQRDPDGNAWVSKDGEWVLDSEV